MNESINKVEEEKNKSEIKEDTINKVEDRNNKVEDNKVEDKNNKVEVTINKVEDKNNKVEVTNNKGADNIGEDKNNKVEDIINKVEDTNNKVEVTNNKGADKNIKKESSFLTSTITKKNEDVPLGSEDNELKSLQEKFIESNLKDSVLFKSKCKLYIYNKEKNKFDERGIGDIMINKEKDSELTKVVMIRESIMRFGCNHYINPRHKLMKNNNVANGWMWVTTEDTVDDEEHIKKKMYLVKFDENELSEKFKEEYEGGMKNNKEVLER